MGGGCSRVLVPGVHETIGFMDKDAILLAHREHVFPAVFHFFREPLVVSHAKNQFVYDADGSLTGPLWYLYFRRFERLDDDTARAKAERLGLKFGERDQRLGWLAVQDFLAKNP